MAETASGPTLEALVAGRKGRPPVTTGVVHPCDDIAIQGACQAAATGLITPVLIGPTAKIRAAADSAGIDISAYRIEDAPHSHAAAQRAVEMVKAGALDMLMKGSLHTDELMHAVVDPATGLRTERRVSHVYVMEVSTYPRLLLITDAAINIAPDLEAKRDITQNAIDLAQAIGIAMPKVAVLSAVETVSSKLKSTLDAAALCKMADRGQITGGMVEGPLAFDNAIDPGAAREKHLFSPVAGAADIVVCPDLEAGNMLAKQLTYLAGARSAAVVLGARVPIALTSRADSVPTHVASCALGSLLIQQKHDALVGSVA
ncbi:MAG TPA: bifunctional enoyl-CoA hydratase/phosphate acetyltransferase [Caulobacteraceae bacterium]|jgi:phosphotransacetylase|nr:bifunctional enoyl-CoA hydratase/phosphate acetyltransferase [Caulobacteraceae bacterium]